MSLESFGPPIRISLADPYLKTTRAKEHLEALREQLDAFSKSKPYSIVREDDIEHQCHRVSIKVVDTPDRITLIVGDLLYCLRSALDQLVWFLAKLTLSYPEHTQFPILDVLNAGARKTFEKQTAGVPADAVEIIESLQPYHRPDAAAIQSDPLWRLNALCNIDKHRRIPVHGSVSDLHWPHATAALVAAMTVELDQDNVMVTIPAIYKSQMALDPEFSINVMFGDFTADVSCDFAGIERIYDCVTDGVIPKFTRFFK